MNNKKKVLPINYDAVVTIVRKRCEQIGITESQLLEQLPVNSLQEAVMDIKSVFVIGQVLNYEIDSMYDCDLPMEKEKRDELIALLKSYVVGERMERVYDMIIQSAERMGEKRFFTMLKEIIEYIKRKRCANCDD